MVVWYKLIISVALCLAIGFFSGFFIQTGDGSWYSTLDKPTFNPPGYLFGIVWIILYICIGLALYFLWVSNAKLALLFFFVQLMLNFLWSFFFFYLQAPLLAFIEICFLLASIILTMVFAYTTSPTAVYLFIPYLLWVCFAAILNLSIYLLN
ncbi:MAG: TspO/MBR family protein [Candidatus Nanoarchaeia archaeon]